MKSELNGPTYEKLFEQQDIRLGVIESLLKDHVSATGQIVSELRLLRTELVNLVSGKDQMPIESVKFLQTMFISAVRTLSAAFACIILWITGLKYFAPHLIP